MGVSTSGTSAPVILASPGTDVTRDEDSNMVGIAVAGSTLYYADLGLEGVYKIPLTGGTTTNVGNARGGSAVLNVAVDANYVYSVDDQGVFKLPLGGGSAIAVMTASPSYTCNQSYTIVVDANDAYWVCGTSLYRTSLSSPGTPVTIDAGPVGQTIALDASGLYWVSNGALVTAPVVGGVPGTVKTLAATGGPMTLDATAVYWATSTAVMKRAK
jgi:hypothetical protein